MHGEDEDFHLRKRPPNPSGDFQPIGWAHRDVGDDYVGLKLLRERYGFVTVASLSGYFVVPGGLKYGAKAPADNRMIVGENYTKMSFPGHLCTFQGRLFFL
jgi:hypothetical protein